MATYTQTEGTPDGRQWFMDVEISPATLAAGTLATRLDPHRYPELGITAAENRGLVVATTVVLTASSLTPAAAASVTLTATLAAPGGAFGPSGTVTFKDGATTLGTGTIAGGVATFVATAGFAVGAHSLTAVYPGTVHTLPQTSAPVVVTAA